MQVKLLEQLEAQKEKRVAHLQQMAVKRMMQAGLTKGWQTWLDLYEERQRSMRMLAAAAGRLMRPALAAALTHWRIDWQQMQQAAIKAAYKARVRLAEEASLKKLAQQAEAAREARVAHLQQSAARRMMQAGLTKGWQTWLDMYLEHQRHQRMLASAAGRLMKPALSAALSVWRDTLALTLTLSPALSLALALTLSPSLTLRSCGATSGGRNGSTSSTRGRRSCCCSMHSAPSCTARRCRPCATSCR